MTRRRIAVDWQACKAHGVCAELLPEIVELDEWGYPVIAPGPVPASLKRYAQRAVSSCPTLALRLVAFVEKPATAPNPGTADEPLVAPGSVAGSVAAALGGPDSTLAPDAGTPAVPHVTREVSPRRRARRSS
jgi:ferredoxin